MLSALPIVNLANCCCLWIVGGGALAAHMARHNRPISLGRGALVGFGAGVVGALVWLVAFGLVDAVIGPFEQRMLSRVLERSADIPPDVREMLEGGRRTSRPVRYAVGFLFQLGAGMVFATLGGLLAVVVAGGSTALAGPEPDETDPQPPMD